MNQVFEQKADLAYAIQKGLEEKVILCRREGNENE